MPYTSANPEYMSVTSPGTYPSPLHTSVLAHIIHAHIPMPLGWTAPLLTRMMRVVVSSAFHRVSVCACGHISVHKGWAQSAGSVNSWVARGTGVCGCCSTCAIGVTGSGMWILYWKSMGVAGTMPVGIEVGLGCREYPMCVGYHLTGANAHHCPFIYWNR